MDHSNRELLQLDEAITNFLVFYLKLVLNKDYYNRQRYFKGQLTNHTDIMWVFTKRLAKYARLHGDPIYY